MTTTTTTTGRVAGVTDAGGVPGTHRARGAANAPDRSRVVVHGR
jgi:hypothetical protein